jgi:hypothetical protein
MAYKRVINDIDSEVIISELDDKYTLSLSKDVATFTLDVLKKRYENLKNDIKENEKWQRRSLERKNNKIQNWHEKFDKSIEDILDENCNEYRDVEDVTYGSIATRFDTVDPDDEDSLDDISALMVRKLEREERAECNELEKVISKLSSIIKVKQETD